MTAKEVLEIVRQIERKEFINSNDQIMKRLKSLESDIAGNFYTVVVVGEFNNGKSTFVNALLGTPLLPMNILPETATINAIMYSDEPRVSVVTNEGEQIGEATPKFFARFSAQKANEKTLKQIRYVKIGYPIDLLKNRIVLVDTPGVADLSDQRSEITYNFLPKADTIIFVLDANAPLKKSEKDFIENHLLPLGITDILFLVNKFDCVDDEEDADLLDEIKRRLNRAFDTKKTALKHIECLPVSALDALNGMSNNHERLIELSGINEVRSKLTEMLSASNLGKKKTSAVKGRLHAILKTAEAELKQRRAMKFVEAEDLRRVADMIAEQLTHNNSEKENILAYTKRIKQQIFMITDKSLSHFQKILWEEISDSVNRYKGVDFKEFIEHDITKSLRKNFEGWLPIYLPSIDQMLFMLERELALGLSRRFNQSVRLTAKKSDLTRDEINLSLQAEDLSNISFQVGAIAAVGSVGILAFFGSSVFPFLSLAAIPLLRERMLKQRLASAKAQVLPEIENQIAKLMHRLQGKLHEYIENRCNKIVQNTEYAYETILTEIHLKIQEEINAKKSEEIIIEQEVKILTSQIEEVTSYLKCLEK